MKKVEHVACGPFANASEKDATDRLLSKLTALSSGQHWVLLTNVAYSVDARGTPLEIDIIVVGTPGIFIIEVKHWDRGYLNANPAVVQREAEKLHAKAQRVATTVRRFMPELGFVSGSFLLTKEKGSLGNADRPTIAGAAFFSLPEWRQLLAVDAASLFSESAIEQICRSIKPTSAVTLSGDLRRLAGIIDLQMTTPPQERFHRIYRGRRAIQQDPVILHLYDLSAYDGPYAERVAGREYETLQRLQKSPWLPRIMDSFQEVPQYPGELYYFSIADPAAPALRIRGADPSWTVEQRISFAASSLQALAELQADPGGLVHRNINPWTLLAQANDTALLTGLHMAKADAGTVSPGYQPPPELLPYLAPEVRANGLSVADARSDVFAMAATLSELFFNDGDGTTARDVLKSALAERPDQRTDARTLGKDFRNVLLAGKAATAAPPASVPLPPVKFWSEDLLVTFNGNPYRILSRLGSGAFGTTFKVVQEDAETGDQLSTFVAKVLYERGIGTRALRAYKQVRTHTTHPNLSVIFETAREWSEDSFVALMKWVDGQRLSDLAGVIPLYFEEAGAESAESLMLSWAQDLCDGLSSLHRAALVHGDVSPKNILVSGAKVTLTDYDLVCLVGSPRFSPGATAYVPADAAANKPARLSDDIFALSASLYYIVTEREPFRSGGVYAPERGVVWDRQQRDEYPILAAFVDKATHPEPAQRFADATEAEGWLGAAREAKAVPAGDLTAVADTDRDPSVAATTPATSESALDQGKKAVGRDITVAPSVTTITPRQAGDGGGTESSAAAVQPLTPNEVPWLLSVLQTYPGARQGSSEARGLDTPFAAATYVETELEGELLAAIRERRVRLIILCGNAGDGKTALLQYIAGRLGITDLTSAQRIWKANLPDGLEVRANLDGAAAFKGREPADLLDEFFAPFLQGPPAEDVRHLLAINDGPLLEWVTRDADHRTPLSDRLWEALAGMEMPVDSYIRFIDLNLRSLVGGIKDDAPGIDTEFPDRLITKLLGGEQADQIWSPCRTCTARDRCPMNHTSRLLRGLNDPGNGPDLARRVKLRLYAALQAVHQRNEVHITTRELRGTLSYVFFGSYYCTDLHNDPELKPPLYFDLAFDPDAPLRQGDVLKELARLDPALEAHPQVDRYVLNHRDEGGDGMPPRFPELSLPSARRRAYFEWSDAHVARVGGSSEALGLARGQHLRLFQRLAFMDEDDRQAICRDLCAGISRLEDLPPVVLRRPGVVPLKIAPRTPVESAFWVEKRLDRFTLVPEKVRPQRGLPALHRYVALAFQYADGRQEFLRLNSELFHLLLDLRDGFQLADAVSDDTFANLSIFTQRLAQEDERALFAWSPIDESRVYEVRPVLKDEVQRLELRPHEAVGI